MLSLSINGQQSQVDAGSLQKLGDILELVKTMIDPDHIITGVRLNGRELEDNDWSSPGQDYQTAIVEIETGTPEVFVEKRIELSWQVARSIYMEFRDARKYFQAGNTQSGNKILVSSVHALKAFLDWYRNLVELMPEAKRKPFNLDSHMERISEVCKKICQQQLYQSWWAIGQSLEKELEPELDALEDYLRKLPRVSQVQ